MEESVINYKGNYYLRTDIGYKKITLTTDPDLIADGIQAIDDDFLQWFVKNPSCEWVEVEIKPMFPMYSTFIESIDNPPFYGNLERKIIIPQEEPKQETNFYEDLKKHFENTPREKLLEEWEKSAESDKVGPTVEEFLNNSKQETVEEAAKNQWGNVHRTGVLGFIEGAKWQEERMYSEEDMLAFLDWSKSTNKEKSEYELKCLLNGKDIDSKKLFIMWFEKFKKK
jgi:hypothetical protein